VSSFFARITPVEAPGGPVDPGFGRPGGGGPVDPGFGRPVLPPHVGGGPIQGGGPVDPGFGHPRPPVDPGYSGGHPIYFPWPPPNPPIAAPPIYLPPNAQLPIWLPDLPIVIPQPPEKPLPDPPAVLWPPLPPGVGINGKALILVWVVGVGYRWIVAQGNEVWPPPDQGKPPDGGKPPVAQPK